MSTKEELSWQFFDDKGSFRLRNPHHTNSLYFPLTNEAGIFSAVTPILHGDIKTSHNSFLSVPVSVENLHDSRSARNFWIYIDEQSPWSVCGHSAKQISQRFSAEDEETVLEAGFLWHRLIRVNKTKGIKVTITNFVPAEANCVELMKVVISNHSDKPIQYTPTAAIPIYGRSADNLRDHRHVTSLLNRTSCCEYGVLVTPTLSFDERGHQTNDISYAVLGIEEEGIPPKGFFPVIEDFIGEGGSLDWPQSVVQNLQPKSKSDTQIDGYESIGGIRFHETRLRAGEKHSYILIMAIMKEISYKHLIKKYGSEKKFDRSLEMTENYWQSKIEGLQFNTGNNRLNGWLRWVTLQPILRRFFGNSFLPYHDYGRGGRGWRDLWQDNLALILMGNLDVGDLLINNYGGVRVDGSNATVIGSSPGEFKADRNNIPRVWMDHGVWPLFTTELYINQTGNLDFLLQEQVYFKDHLINRANGIDTNWTADQGIEQLTVHGKPYSGTILEHLLVQHLVPFFNVGAHNNIRLEGADWNDAMDMAAQNGESVAFTALYAGNLRKIGDWALLLEKTGIKEVKIAAELVMLLDTLKNPVNYNVVKDKNERLNEYYGMCNHFLSGEKESIGIEKLGSDLLAKSEWLSNHIREEEWVTDSAGYGWFNGYYDNNGERVEGEFPNGVRMILTAQVFALMSGVADNTQAEEIIRSVDRYLFDESVGGYRLNTDFGGVMPALGRGFGFAYGHKENGAMFSHMAVMFANALYGRGFVHQGYSVLEKIFAYCQDFSRSRIYPGIPEYINQQGRGMYPYLTGSASWYLLTLVTESFGIKGCMGNLVLEPKLVSKQFDLTGTASITTRFSGKKLDISYNNPKRIDYGEYQIISATLDDVPVAPSQNEIMISRDEVLKLDHNIAHHIEVNLGISKDKNVNN